MASIPGKIGRDKIYGGYMKNDDIIEKIPGILTERGPLSIKQMQEVLGLSYSTTADRLSRMYKNGTIKRTTGRKRKKPYYLYYTDDTLKT